MALLLGSAPLASDASTVSGDQIARTARAQLGVPYAWSGNGPNSFDCSGLVRFVFARHGITNIPRSSIEQHRWSRSITRSQLRPGDLVFQSYSSRNGVNGTDHVAIYIGNGRVVDASSGQGGVIERAIIERTVTGYGRVPGTAAATTATRTAVVSTGTTRAEAARIVADVMGLRNRANPFGVTTEAGAVGAVYHAGIGRAYNDGTWRPNTAITSGQLAVWLDRANVTRAQAARIIAGVMKLPNRANPFGVTTHGGAVGAVYHAGIGLPYADGTWRPNTRMTRTQADLWMRRSGMR
jgi:cell wall-associated NlpC family hydrolase